MRDVARRAGVSPATVSRVINNPEKVRIKLREAAGDVFVVIEIGEILRGGDDGDFPIEAARGFADGDHGSRAAGFAGGSHNLLHAQPPDDGFE